jgi:hypothetical protein
MSLGLRYCPNHPGEPLMLVSTASGTWWRCEHPSGCAYTEDALSGPRSAVAVNGRAFRARRSGRDAVRTHGGSSVEYDAIARQDQIDTEAH